MPSAAASADPVATGASADLPDGPVEPPQPASPQEVGTPAASPSPDTARESSSARPHPVDPAEVDRLVAGEHHDPHGLLGGHVVEGRAVLRALRPDAGRVVAVVRPGADDEARVDLEHEHGGLFSVALDEAGVPDYRLDVTYGGDTFPGDDPYRWLPTLGEVDLHLVAEGRHERLWTVLGSHVREFTTVSGTVSGTSFAVWAPNARGVRVVGEFNSWDGRTHPMRSLGGSGVWELFVPGVGPDTPYRYEVLGADGQRRHKADPLARATELVPGTASVVTRSAYEWGDEDWLTRRAQTQPHAAPMSTYEVHLGSWRQGLSYRDLAEELVAYVTDLGYTHVELLPVAEHPFGGSWGYQVSSYYAPTSRFGSPDDFRHLVDRLHQAGVGVLLDWVPGHFPKDEFSLGRFDGTALYEHADPRRGDQPDWGTFVFDFGRPEVRNFLVANALYWCEEFHVDGLRVDAVASMLYLDYSRADGQWLPNVYGGRENLDAIAMLQETNALVYREQPGVVVVAEESTSWPGVTRPTHLGGLGFGFKWNMGWMHDTLDYLSREPVYRGYHHHQLTFALMYAFSENFVLPISHDEVVHGKGSLLRKVPGDRWQQLATVRALLAFMWAHPGKQLLFMGQEFAQEAEWSEARGLDWWTLDLPDHRGVQSLVRDLNREYVGRRALWSLDVDAAGFEWVDANDATNNVFSFVRRGDDGSQLVCVVNFSGVPHHDYRLGLPASGTWREVVNTDADVYTGSGVGNAGAVTAVDQPHHGMPASAAVQVPPLGALWFVQD